MADVMHLQMNALEDWFAEHRDQHLDVIIAGRIFGGRHGESMQRPREFEFDGTTLQIRFATTEKLTVENALDIQLGEYGQLIIPRASRVVFGWHYYGREQTPDNWCEEIYKSNNGLVQLTRTGPLMPGVEQIKYNDERFVELR
jgi:hypothetical protein